MSLRKINYVLLLISAFLFIKCNDDNANTLIDIQIEGNINDFGEVPVLRHSSSQYFFINGENIDDTILLEGLVNFEISLDNENFSNSLSILIKLGKKKMVFVRFSPTENTIGVVYETLTIAYANSSTKSIVLNGIATPSIGRITTFENVLLSFKSGGSQTVTNKFTFPDDTNTKKAIKMYVKLQCPSDGCGDWDVFSNIKIKNSATGEWYELGRFITPYGVDNSDLEKGFEIDVTDFKSILKGEVELKAFIEVYTARGWLLTVDFELIAGEPDYKYSSITPILNYTNNSQQVSYGDSNNIKNMNAQIDIPSNIEDISFRTIISGWGHAYPLDPDGRPCAEWCYRTHNITIDEITAFEHYMGPIGCGSNPVSPQGGNWEPDRAGWCPGMAIPVRKDKLDISNAGKTISYDYKFEPWVNDFSEGSAYYSISSFIIVRSNTPIDTPLKVY